MAEGIAGQVKVLRKIDPKAAERLKRSLKRKQSKARKREAKEKQVFVKLEDDLVAISPPERNEEEEGNSTSELIPHFRTVYLEPGLSHRLKSLQETLRSARGTDDEELVSLDRVRPRYVAQQMRDGSPQDTVGEGDASDSDNGDESSPEESIFGEFAVIFKRHAALEERALRRTTNEEVLEEDASLMADTEFQEGAQDGQQQGNLRAGLADEGQSRPKRTVAKLSKKKLKELTRPPVSELKLNCSRPDVVEVWDVTAPDPYTLVWLKAYRNTVKVPVHWNQKRKYLSGKRAIEKPPFRLPEYIEQTKIGEIRAAILERESQKSLKQKQREKSRPKSNRMHVDFQTLHDAFFKYATKPELTPFGELYYEGKEREEKTRQFRPGQLSAKLKEALGIVLATTPTPWLLTMQRYGPPPSYPNLRIPGLNAPLPLGAQWGFHQGGWGKPPSDQFGNPLYPEVFAEPTPPVKEPTPDESAPPQFWGELLEGAWEESEEDELEDAGENAESAGEQEDGPMAELSASPSTLSDAAAGAGISGLATSTLETTQALLVDLPSAHVNTLPVLPGGLAPPSEVLSASILSGGLATPSALIQSAATSDFSPEGIKEQLKVHDEANRKAHEVSVQEGRKQSEEKKKKKQFKF